MKDTHNNQGKTKITIDGDERNHCWQMECGVREEGAESRGNGRGSIKLNIPCVLIVWLTEEDVLIVILRTPADCYFTR